MEKITTILLFLSVSCCFSQTTIALKKTTFEIENQNFYIAKVLDERIEKDLGLLENRFGKKVKLRIQNDPVKTIEEFMEALLISKISKVPVTISIHNLKIEQAQTSIDERTARVYIALNFYGENGTALFTIAHYEEQKFPESNLTEIYNTHEQRIRAAIEYCLWSFSTSQKGLAKNLTKNGMSEPKPFAKDTLAIKSYVPLGKWFNMLTMSRIKDVYTQGWNVAYTAFSDHEKDFIIPFVIGYGQSRATSNILQERGYLSVDSYIFDFGCNGFIKITSGLYAAIGIQMPIGMEILRNLENEKSRNFLIGLRASQGVKIIPWKDYGIVMGAGIFQRWQTSKLIHRNFGFQLEVGINF